VVPLKVIGRMVLDKNPVNVFAETEQVAYCTTHIVPGIDFTNDPLLQGRNFSYLDTQLKRLGGPNFTQIPINQPRCPMHNFQRDGHMNVSLQQGRVSYEPSLLNSNEGVREDPSAATAVPPYGRRATSCGPGQRRSATTTARPGSSSSARPSLSRTTSSPPSPSS